MILKHISPQSRTLKKIGILTEPGLSCNGMPEAVKIMFPRADIQILKSQFLTMWGLQNIDMLVLPGNADEKSNYPTLLTKSRRAHIKQKIEMDGMALMTFCAASYYLMDDISYTTRENEEKIARGLGWVKGHAFQAFAHITRTKSGLNELEDDYIEATLKPRKNSNHKLKCLNVNGPAFELTGQDKSLCDVFLHYADLQNSPAAFSKKMGKGLIVALGIHPELSAQTSTYTQTRTWNFEAHEKDRLEILERIAHHVKIYFRPHQIVFNPSLEVTG